MRIQMGESLVLTSAGMWGKYQGRLARGGWGKVPEARRAQLIWGPVSAVLQVSGLAGGKVERSDGQSREGL